jgi:hypothetical protein
MAKANEKKSRLVYSNRFFPVAIGVFEHRNDEGRLNHSVKLTRSFRRGPEAEWEQTDYLSAQDLLPAAKLLDEAYAFVQKRLQQAYQESRAASEELEAAEIPY